MCDPVSLSVATFAIGAGSAGLSYMGQRQQANMQQKVELQRFGETERFRWQNAEAAQKNFAEQTAQLQIRQRQEQVAASEKNLEAERQTRQAEGAVMASTTGAGAGLGLILNNYQRAQGRVRSDIGTQLEWSGAQYATDTQAAQAQAYDAINSVRPYVMQPIAKPQLAGLVLDIGKAALDSKNTYYRTASYASRAAASREAA